mgnify:FL=1
MFQVPESYRVDGSKTGFPNTGNEGAFLILGPLGRHLACIATLDKNDTGEKWEHISITLPVRPGQTPTWAEMDYAKSVFWDPQDIVIQFHPPESTKVNLHEGCLHLWRPLHCPIPLPQYGMVEPCNDTTPGDTENAD